MHNATNLTDKLIIFTGCLIIYLFRTDPDVSVAVVLTGIIFSGFLSYFDDGRLRSVLTAGFSVISCFVPQLVFFLPLIAYDMLYYRYQYINLIGLVPLVYFTGIFPVQTVSAVFAMLLTGLLIKHRSESQLRLSVRNNELIDSAREMSFQLKKQNNDLMEKQDYEVRLATLNERNRIAREIHDNVGHLLSSAILQSGALITINQDQNARVRLQSLNDTLNQAMDSIRSSVHELYDESVDLNIQLKNIVDEFKFCDLSYDCDIGDNPDKKLKYAFIAIIKEALSNIIKHSEATKASIALREHPGLYQLIIRDNGTCKKYNMDEGLGLKSMVERVESLNGNINITTTDGFEIFISIPKEGIDENTGC